MLIALFLAAITATAAPADQPLPGFRPSAWFDEQVREEWLEGGARVLVQAPRKIDLARATRLIIYATPNGNSIEETLGCGKREGLDWHFDIQHVAAQIRTLRGISPDENIVLACIEPEGLSWPAWKRKYRDSPARIRSLIETLRGWLPAKTVRIALAGHSGGGSFLFGFIDGGETIPEPVERIVFLDANYAYSDADRHGDKLLSWLQVDRARRLVVIAYDDREITLNGKKVIGPDGGTYRATERMRARFAKDLALIESKDGDVVARTALDGRIALVVHANPKNLILHTALVGEMNGLLRGLIDPEPKPTWGRFGGPRAYTKFVQPVPGIPKQPADAIGGKEFFRKIDKLTPAGREAAIAQEIMRGNIPNFLRAFRTITVKGKDAAGKEHTATVEVMPDYLAVGSDADFVRVPMTPMTAARIADGFGCALPTRKVVDEAYSAAAIKLEPLPLTERREAAATFLLHHNLIEEQRGGRKLGELVAGTKKDVVVTNRLTEKPDRVAIYGWHKLDGKPIQPLSIVHVNSYVDYSHGVRLMKRSVTVDGRTRDVRHVLYDPALCRLLSDEGPVTRPTY
jgi:hypothetical protein